MSTIEFPARLFVTGTDTGVGKTLVSAILLTGLRSTYWKPVQSGIGEGSDSEWIRRATSLGSEHFLPETYRLRRPLSPHAAAALEGVRIELDDFPIPDIPGRLIVEGAGGIMVPLNDRHLMLDLMKKFGFPVLLVARRTLGTINHTLLSLEALRRHGLEVFGVVMNGPGDESTRGGGRDAGRGGAFPLGNRETIESCGRARVLAEIEPLPEITPKALCDAFDHYFGKGREHG